MKRPTASRRLRQKRIAKFRARRRARRSKRSSASPGQRYVRPGERISAPRRIDIIRGSGAELVKFLRAVAQTVLVASQPVVLDFRFTHAFYPAGTLLLLAELDRVIAMSPLPKPITLINPRLGRPREVLKQIGVHDMTGDVCNVVPSRQDVVFWKATKGKDQSGGNIEMLEAVARKVNQAHANQLSVSGAWRGLSEAVANSVDHAYKRPRVDGFAGLESTRWWMLTQLRGGIFTMAVCDLGCGYRATINQTIPALLSG